MTIGKRLRFEVLRRDGYRCVYCGVTSKETTLTIDHVVAEKLGGTDDPANLVAACPNCNEGKASTTVDAAFIAKVDEDAQRWMRAMAAAVQLRRKRLAVHDGALLRLDEVWTSWTYKETEQPIPRPDNWEMTAESLLAAGLPIDEMLRLVPVAMQARTITLLDFSEWRYFYGCCRRVLGEIEGTARVLLANETAAGERTDVSAQPEEILEREPTLNDLP